MTFMFPGLSNPWRIGNILIAKAFWTAVYFISCLAVKVKRFWILCKRIYIYTMSCCQSRAVDISWHITILRKNKISVSNFKYIYKSLSQKVKQVADMYTTIQNYFEGLPDRIFHIMWCGNLFEPWIHINFKVIIFLFFNKKYLYINGFYLKTQSIWTLPALFFYFKVILVLYNMDKTSWPNEVQSLPTFWVFQVFK